MRRDGTHMPPKPDLLHRPLSSLCPRQHSKTTSLLSNKTHKLHPAAPSGLHICIPEGDIKMDATRGIFEFEFVKDKT